MKNKLSLMLCSFLYLAQAQAFVCPVEDKNIPLCPSSGSTFLAEDYPIRAVVVSTSAWNQDELFEFNGKSIAGLVSKIQTPMNFILKIMKGHNYENVPPIVVPTDKASFERLKRAVATGLLSVVESSKADLLIEQLVHVEAESYTWQQDYFETFFNPSTGSTEVRPIVEYTRYKDENDKILVKETATKIAKALSKCNVVLGADLPGNGKSSGEENVKMGGAIEGLPGGLCMVSNNQSQTEFTNEFCNEDNTVKINTEWLYVGHVDEIVKFVPRSPAKNKCDFDILVSSPKLGMDLLKANAQDKLVDLSLYDTEAKREQFLSKWLPDDGPFAEYLCGLVTRNIYTKDSEEDCAKNIRAYGLKLKNGEVYQGIMKDDILRHINRLVQIEMDKVKQAIQAKLVAKMPECTGQYTFIDVPNVFLGFPMDVGNGKFAMDFADAISIFPNPSNGVYSKNTMIFPEPHQPSFKAYLKKAMTPTGNQVEFVDTWNYAHVGLGNLNCSTHVMRYCRVK